MNKKSIILLAIATSGLMIFMIPILFSDIFLVLDNYKLRIIIQGIGIFISYLGAISYMFTYLRNRQMRRVEKKSAQIFFIFAIEDKDRVENIYTSLKKRGYHPWISTQDLIPGQIWKDTVEKALIESELALVFLSKISINKKGYLQNEIKLALDMLSEHKEGFSPVIPIRLDDVDISIKRLKEIQNLDLYIEEDINKLFNALDFYLGKGEK